MWCITSIGGTLQKQNVSHFINIKQSMLANFFIYISSECVLENVGCNLIRIMICHSLCTMIISIWSISNKAWTCRLDNIQYLICTLLVLCSRLRASFNGQNVSVLEDLFTESINKRKNMTVLTTVMMMKWVTCSFSKVPPFNVWHCICMIFVTTKHTCGDYNKTLKQLWFQL